MDTLGITLAVLLILGTLLFIVAVVFLARLISKHVTKAKGLPDEPQERWNLAAWNRFKK